jgi:hypothetical protein
MYRLPMWSGALVLSCALPTLSLAQVTDPPLQYGNPQVLKGVAFFGCGTSQNCSITCSFPGGPKTFTNVPWAVVGNYSNSTHLWLKLGNGPNENYLLGDAFCDFSKIATIIPLQ